MTKIATYVLMVSNVFPKGSKLEGINTHFPEKIRDGVKIHTIRGNYPLWKKRIDAVVAGEAVLSIREWSGKPYRSSQVEIIQLDHLSGIGIEKVKLLLGTVPLINDSIMPLAAEVAQNDGLSIDEFHDWFKGYVFNTEMAIIHFTSFRYSQQKGKCPKITQKNTLLYISVNNKLTLAVTDGEGNAYMVYGKNFQEQLKSVCKPENIYDPQDYEFSHFLADFDSKLLV